VSGDKSGGFTPDARFSDEAGSAISAGTLEWHRPGCGAAGACVEIANLPEGGVAIRDGKSGDASPVLTFTQDEWGAFTAAIRSGELS
jgi:hypothetical protein